MFSVPFFFRIPVDRECEDQTEVIVYASGHTHVEVAMAQR